MRAAIACLIITFVAVPANSRQIYGKPYGYEDVEWVFTKPKAEPTMASVGTEMARRYQYGIVRITQHQAAKTLKLEDGFRLYATNFLAMSNFNGGLVACKYDGPQRVCLVDQNNDGQFEGSRILGGEGLKIAALPELVPYQPPREEKLIDPTGVLITSLVYMGEAAGALRFSHREYKANLARPAFTEELSFPRPATLPATIVIKDLEIEVRELSNAGIRYVVRQVGGAKP